MDITDVAPKKIEHSCQWVYNAEFPSGKLVPLHEANILLQKGWASSPDMVISATMQQQKIGKTKVHFMVGLYRMFTWALKRG